MENKEKTEIVKSDIQKLKINNEIKTRTRKLMEKTVKSISKNLNIGVDMNETSDFIEVPKLRMTKTRIKLNSKVSNECETNACVDSRKQLSEENSKEIKPDPQCSASDNISSELFKNKFCEVCKSTMSSLEFASHLQKCLASKFTRGDNTSEPRRDLNDKWGTQTNKFLQQKIQDEQNVNHEQLLEQANKVVLDCVLCGKKFFSTRSKSIHVKKCAIENKTNVGSLNKIMEQQQEERQTKLDAGILPDDFCLTKLKIKQATVKRKKLKSQEMDDETQLALALSRSMVEQQKEMNHLINLNQALLGPEGTIVAKDPSKTTKKGKKAKQMGKQNQLEHYSKEQVDARINERVETYIFNHQEKGSVVSTPRFKGSAKQFHGEKLWRKSILKNDSEEIVKEIHQYYVPEIMPPIAVTTVKPGSKIKRISSIPGRELPTNVFTTEDEDPSIEAHKPHLTQTVDILTELALGSEDKSILCSEDFHSSLAFEKQDSFEKSMNLNRRMTKLSHDFLTLVNNPNHSDIEIHAKEGVVIPAHSLIISIRCPLLFLQILPEKSHNSKVIDLSEFKEESILCFLRYIYSGQLLESAIHRVDDLHKLAKRFGIQELDFVDSKDLSEKHFNEKEIEKIRSKNNDTHKTTKNWVSEEGNQCETNLTPVFETNYSKMHVEVARFPSLVTTSADENPESCIETKEKSELTETFPKQQDINYVDSLHTSSSLSINSNPEDHKTVSDITPDSHIQPTNSMPSSSPSGINLSDEDLFSDKESVGKDISVFEDVISEHDSINKTEINGSEVFNKGVENVIYVSNGESILEKDVCSKQTLITEYSPKKSPDSLAQAYLRQSSSKKYSPKIFSSSSFIKEPTNISHSAVETKKDGREKNKMFKLSSQTKLFQHDSNECNSPDGNNRYTSYGKVSNENPNADIFSSTKLSSPKGRESWHYSPILKNSPRHIRSDIDIRKMSSKSPIVFGKRPVLSENISSKFNESDEDKINNASIFHESPMKFHDTSVGMSPEIYKSQAVSLPSLSQDQLVGKNICVESNSLQSELLKSNCFETSKNRRKDELTMQESLNLSTMDCLSLDSPFQQLETDISVNVERQPSVCSVNVSQVSSGECEKQSGNQSHDTFFDDSFEIYPELEAQVDQISFDRVPAPNRPQQKTNQSNQELTPVHNLKMVRKKNWKEPSPFTPMPQYDNMNTPELKKAVMKIGVRPLGKKRNINLLKHVYQETHQYETDSEYEGTPIKRVRAETRTSNELCSEIVKSTSNHGTKNTASVIRNTQSGEESPMVAVSPHILAIKESCKTIKESARVNERKECELNSSQEDVEFNCSQEDVEFNCSQEDVEFNCSQDDIPDFPEESILQGWPDEDDIPSTQSTQTSKEAQAEALTNFIKQNKDIYEKILLYEALELDALKSRIAEAGIRIGMARVMDYLDERCITFTMKKMRNRNKNQKQQVKNKSKSPRKANNRKTKTTN